MSSLNFKGQRGRSPSRCWFLSRHSGTPPFPVTPQPHPLPSVYVLPPATQKADTLPRGSWVSADCCDCRNTSHPRGRAFPRTQVSSFVLCVPKSAAYQPTANSLGEPVHCSLKTFTRQALGHDRQAAKMKTISSSSSGCSRRGR